MLISCPECNKQVSDKATVCPDCAFPLGKRVEDEKATIIEATNKKWKKYKLIGGTLVVLPMLTLCKLGFDSPIYINLPMAITMFAGLVLMIMGSFGSWWHHR